MKSTEQNQRPGSDIHRYAFERLEVWSCARQFVKSIYVLTREFPNEERFGLTSQLRRAALSIPTNLAEGSARKTPKDQANFTQISYSSLIEIVNLLFIAKDLGYIEDRTLDELRSAANEISFKINALYRSQKAKAA